MKKFLQKQMKKSDKGFSLVELIVVIAIMAVLIGVIAPAFMKYVGKSKDSADKASIEQLEKAANTVLADPELGKLKVTASASKTFVINNTTTPVGITNNVDVTATNDNSFEKLLEAALGKDGNDVKYPNAKNGTNKFTITISGDEANGFSAKVTQG